MRRLVRRRPRIVLMRDKGRITIPSVLREAYGLDEGSEVFVYAEEDRLVLYPHRVPPARAQPPTAQAQAPPDDDEEVGLQELETGV